MQLNTIDVAALTNTDIGTQMRKVYKYGYTLNQWETRMTMLSLMPFGNSEEHQQVKGILKRFKQSNYDIAIVNCHYVRLCDIEKPTRYEEFIRFVLHPDLGVGIYLFVIKYAAFIVEDRSYFETKEDMQVARRGVQCKVLSKITNNLI